MRRLPYILLLLLVAAASAVMFSPAQVGSVRIRTGATNPSKCTPGKGSGEQMLFYNTSAKAFYYCSDADTWSEMGGGATPGGSSTQVQFNDSDVFGGDAGFTYNKTTDTATVGALLATGAHQITMSERTAPSAPDAGDCTVYGDTTAHAVKAACNAGSYVSLFPSYPLNFGTYSTQPGGETKFAGPVGDHTGEAVATAPMPHAGTVTALYARVDTAPGASQSVTFTLRKNAADTSVTCSISGSTATTCNDTSNSATFAAGDELSTRVVTSAGAATVIPEGSYLIRPD